jgi:hypothetical protein
MENKLFSTVYKTDILHALYLFRYSTYVYFNIHSATIFLYLFSSSQFCNTNDYVGGNKAGIRRLQDTLFFKNCMASGYV